MTWAKRIFGLLVLAAIGGLVWLYFLAPDGQKFGPLADWIAQNENSKTEQIDLDAVTEDAFNPADKYEDIEQPDVFHYPPPDETAFDPTFLAFRAELRAATMARDLDKVLALSSENIRLSLDGVSGREQWRALLADPEAGIGYWERIADAVHLPAAKADGPGYCAPYFACGNLPEGIAGIDPFDTVFIIAAEVPAYSAPDDQADVLMTFSYDVVKLGAYVDDPDWAEIVLPEGKGEGYIRRKDFRSGVGFHVTMEKIDGVWLVTSFLAEE